MQVVGALHLKPREMSGADVQITDTLYFGNLDERVTSRVLYDLCNQVGNVLRVTFPKQNDEVKTKYAFGEFESLEGAAYAWAALRGCLKLYGRPLQINFSKVGGGTGDPEVLSRAQELVRQGHQLQLSENNQALDSSVTVSNQRPKLFARNPMQLTSGAEPGNQLGMLSTSPTPSAYPERSADSIHTAVHVQHLPQQPINQYRGPQPQCSVHQQGGRLAHAGLQAGLHRSYSSPQVAPPGIGNYQQLYFPHTSPNEYYGAMYRHHSHQLEQSRYYMPNQHPPCPQQHPAQPQQPMYHGLPVPQQGQAQYACIERQHQEQVNVYSAPLQPVQQPQYSLPPPPGQSW